MKKKVVKKVVSRKATLNFDSTEFLLLAFVALILLAYFGMRMGLLPQFIRDSVLGVTTSR